MLWSLMGTDSFYETFCLQAAAALKAWKAGRHPDV
jgi:hypothetical protein